MEWEITPEMSHVLWADPRFRRIMAKLSVHTSGLVAGESAPNFSNQETALLWTAAKEIYELENKLVEKEALMSNVPKESRLFYDDMLFRKIVGRLMGEAVLFCRSANQEAYEVAHHVCWEAAKKIFELSKKGFEQEMEIIRLKKK